MVDLCETVLHLHGTCRTNIDTHYAETIPLDMEKRFHSIWRNYFKKFLGLPAALLSNILDQIFTPTVFFSTNAETGTSRKI
jgi:hypothetical protein